ncbi:acyltransferase family protein [Rothia sp. CCM 9416]|uniref:acyltransferase family protein n=1 Tax=Rothia sp. CCM 9416 TaxID=3402655 RepID=UPI003AE4DCBC
MKRLELLDTTRLVAAVMVVFFHWTFNGINNGKIGTIDHPPSISQVTQYGYWGVTLFFLISGFVISYSIQSKTARQYVTARLTRLYPAFWVCLLLTTAVALLVRPGRGMDIQGPAQFFANLTMVPNLLGQDYVDGAYWTLGFELFFYFIVLLIMLIGLANYLTPIMIGWAFLCAADEFLIRHQDYFITSRPFPAFIGGALIASYVFGHRSVFKLLAISCAWLCTISSEVGYSKLLEAIHHRNYSSIVVALLVTCFFAILMLNAIPRIRFIKIPHSRLAGDLTYPLYLLHAHLGYMAISMWAKLVRPELFLLFVVLQLAIFMLLSYCVNRYAERALRKFWKIFFDRTFGSVIEGIDKLFIQVLPYRRTSPPFKEYKI